MTNGKEEVNENYIVASLVRGMKILSTFTVERPSLKVSEIAEITGLDQATVFRFIYTLEHLGYLVRDDETKRYHQSMRMLTIGLPAREGIAVRHVALPVMDELSKEIDESVTLLILDGLEIVTVAVLEVLGKMIYPTPIGHRLPAYCTSAGKVLLAYQPVETWDQKISKIKFLPRTDLTIVDPNLFRAELVKTRQQGYGFQDGELLVGLCSVSAPIFDYNRKIVAALNISGLSMQLLLEERNHYYINQLLNSARTISTRLGYVPEMSE